MKKRVRKWQARREGSPLHKINELEQKMNKLNDFYSDEAQKILRQIKYYQEKL